MIVVRLLRRGGVVIHIKAHANRAGEAGLFSEQRSAVQAIRARVEEGKPQAIGWTRSRWRRDSKIEAGDHGVKRSSGSAVEGDHPELASQGGHQTQEAAGGPGVRGQHLGRVGPGGQQRIARARRIEILDRGRTGRAWQRDGGRAKIKICNHSVVITRGRLVKRGAIPSGVGAAVEQAEQIP